MTKCAVFLSEAIFMMASFDYNYQNSFSFPFIFCNCSGEQRTIALISKDSGSCSQCSIRS